LVKAAANGDASKVDEILSRSDADVGMSNVMKLSPEQDKKSQH
jgi:hypothetical protein